MRRLIRCNDWSIGRVSASAVQRHRCHGLFSKLRLPRHEQLKLVGVVEVRWNACVDRLFHQISLRK